MGAEGSGTFAPFSRRDEIRRDLPPCQRRRLRCAAETRARHHRRLPLRPERQLDVPQAVAQRGCPALGQVRDGQLLEPPPHRQSRIEGGLQYHPQPAHVALRDVASRTEAV